MATIPTSELMPQMLGCPMCDMESESPEEDAGESSEEDAMPMQAPPMMNRSMRMGMRTVRGRGPKNP